MSRADYNVTVPTTLTTLFDETVHGADCTGFEVGCNAATAAPCTGLLVNVTGLHNTGQFVKIYPGASLTFRAREGIVKVEAKGDGGSAIVDYGVTED